MESSQQEKIKDTTDLHILHLRRTHGVSRGGTCKDDRDKGEADTEDYSSSNIQRNETQGSLTYVELHSAVLNVGARHGCIRSNFNKMGGSG